MKLEKKVGYVFQNPDHQIFADTVYEEVAFTPKIRGCSKDEIDKRVKEALRSVDMEGYEEEDPFSLTKGERPKNRRCLYFIGQTKGDYLG